MKRRAPDWGKIPANRKSDQSLVSQICKEFLKLSSKKANNWIRKWVKDMSRHSLKRPHRWQQHRRGWTTSLMQIKTILRHWYTPIRMAKIKNSHKRKWWWGCREIASHTRYWWERDMYSLLGKWSGSFHKNETYFPGGPVVKNLPASAGDVGLIPG